MTTFKEAKIEDGKLVVTDHNGSYTITEDQLIDLLIEDGQMCEDCHNDGEYSTDESDGEGHIMRGVGTQKCRNEFHQSGEDRSED